MNGHIIVWGVIVSIGTLSALIKFFKRLSVYDPAKCKPEFLIPDMNLYEFTCIILTGISILYLLSSIISL